MIYTFTKLLLRLQILFALAVLCTLSQILPYACKSLWCKISFIKFPLQNQPLLSQLQSVNQLSPVNPLTSVHQLTSMNQLLPVNQLFTVHQLPLKNQSSFLWPAERAKAEQKSDCPWVIIGSRPGIWKTSVQKFHHKTVLPYWIIR